jgi:hypothetical protein
MNEQIRWCHLGKSPTARYTLITSLVLMNTTYISLMSDHHQSINCILLTLSIKVWYGTPSTHQDDGGGGPGGGRIP